MLNSCVHQSLEPYEILVGDDSPTDETRKIIEEFNSAANVRIDYQHNTPSLGQGPRKDIFSFEFFARIAASADKALSVPEEFAIWRQTTKGVSVQASLEAHASVIDSYRIITHLLLSYNNTEENKDICAKYIGGFVYTRYPKIKKLLPKIMHLLSEFQRPLMLPERKVLKVLRFFLGWKIALLVINKFKL